MRITLGCSLLVFIAACGGTASPSGGAGGAAMPDGGADADTASSDATGGADGDTASSDAADDAASAENLAGLAFDLELLPNEAGEWCEGDCSPATALVTKASDTSLELLWAVRNRPVKASLTRTESGWTLDGSLQVGVAPKPKYYMCGSDTKLGTATFDFGDHDHDGKIDLIVTGHQESKICSDDTTYGSAGDVTIVGKPDVRLAKLVSTPLQAEPVHGLSLAMDKLLAPGSTCTLLPKAGGDPVALTPEVTDGWVTGFSTNLVLPLGSTYALQFVGKDFTAVGTPAATTMSTTDDFGVLVQDGFESGSMAGISNGEIVDTFGVPPVAGQRMLLAGLAPYTHTLLRLQRAGNETALVMNARELYGCHNPESHFELTVAVVGASGNHPVVLTAGSNATDVFVETKPPYSWTVGETQTVTVELPETGQDVLVYARGEYHNMAWCSISGALLDDVKLQ